MVSACCMPVICLVLHTCCMYQTVHNYASKYNSNAWSEHAWSEHACMVRTCMVRTCMHGQNMHGQNMHGQNMHGQNMHVGHYTKTGMMYVVHVSYM